MNFEVLPPQTIPLFCCVSLLCTTRLLPQPPCVTKAAKFQGGILSMEQVPAPVPQGPGVGGRAASPRVVLLAGEAWRQQLCP